MALRMPEKTRVSEGRKLEEKKVEKRFSILLLIGSGETKADGESQGLAQKSGIVNKV
jgi:hypothetical protein